MSKGYVYILTNPSMPGLVKIGKTCRNVAQRANELGSTGVPTPFEIFFEVLCPDCDEVESWVHRQLSEFRVNNSREFFRCEPEKAATSAKNAQREQVEDWLDQFIPGQSIETAGLCLGEDHFVPLEYETGQHAQDIKDAFESLGAAEVISIVDYWRSRKSVGATS